MSSPAPFPPPAALTGNRCNSRAKVFSRMTTRRPWQPRSRLRPRSALQHHRTQGPLDSRDYGAAGLPRSRGHFARRDRRQGRTERQQGHRRLAEEDGETLDPNNVDDILERLRLSGGLAIMTYTITPGDAAGRLSPPSRKTMPTRRCCRRSATHRRWKCSPSAFTWMKTTCVRSIPMWTSPFRHHHQGGRCRTAADGTGRKDRGRQGPQAGFCL